MWIQSTHCTNERHISNNEYSELITNGRHISSSYRHSCRCHLRHHIFFYLQSLCTGQMKSYHHVIKASYSCLKIWYLNRTSLKFWILSWSANQRNAYNGWTDSTILFRLSHHGKLERQACAYFPALEFKYTGCCNWGVAIHYMKWSFLLKKLWRKR
jgi:hypothetical protein